MSTYRYLPCFHECIGDLASVEKMDRQLPPSERLSRAGRQVAETRTKLTRATLEFNDHGVVDITISTIVLDDSATKRNHWIASDFVSSKKRRARGIISALIS